MAVRLTRRKIAAHVAEKIVAGTKVSEALKEVAAYLIDTKRTREADLLVREVEDMLAEKGIVIADVTSAHPLTASLRGEIQKMIGAKTLQLRESIDPTVLGGVLIDLPGERFDGTIRRKLNALRAKQL